MLPRDLKSLELPWINWNSASVTLQVLLKRCPRLQKLALHPGYTAEDDVRSDEEHCLLDLMQDENCHNHIGQIMHLRELSTTTVLTTRPGLLGIGRLTHLKTLTIHNSTGSVTQRELEDGLFPSLKSLAMYLVHPEDAPALLKIEPMLRSLESLAVNFIIDVLEVDPDCYPGPLAVRRAVPMPQQHLYVETS